MEHPREVIGKIPAIEFRTTGGSLKVNLAIRKSDFSSPLFYPLLFFFSFFPNHFGNEIGAHAKNKLFALV